MCAVQKYIKKIKISKLQKKQNLSTRVMCVCTLTVEISSDSLTVSLQHYGYHAFGTWLVFLCSAFVWENSLWKAKWKKIAQYFFRLTMASLLKIYIVFFLVIIP